MNGISQATFTTITAANNIDQPKISIPKRDSSMKKSMKRKADAGASDNESVIQPTAKVSTSSASSRSYIGPMVRSARIRPVRIGLTKNVEKLCIDFGVPIRPCIPTQDICAQYDEFRKTLINLIDTRRATDRLEQELKSLKSTNNSIIIPSRQVAKEAHDQDQDVNPWVLERYEDME
jgi:hypothetical protein